MLLCIIQPYNTLSLPRSTIIIQLCMCVCTIAFLKHSLAGDVIVGHKPLHGLSDRCLTKTREKGQEKKHK